MIREGGNDRTSEQGDRTLVVGEISREMPGSIGGGIDRQIDIFRGWPRRGGDARGSPKAVLHYNRAPSESLGRTCCCQACRRSLSVAGRVLE